MGQELAAPRRLEPQWDGGLIAASIAISLLGAFTSTQLMCQARMSLRFSSIASWTALGSLTFGFCSIWCLHFVAMLACKLDLPIGIDVFLTVLSAVLAVCFTFIALTSDLLWNKYQVYSNRKRRRNRRRKTWKSPQMQEELSEPLLPSEMEAGSPAVEESHINGRTAQPEHALESGHNEIGSQLDRQSTTGLQRDSRTNGFAKPNHHDPSVDSSDSRRSTSLSSISRSSRRSSSFTSTSQSSTGLRDILNIAYQTTAPAKNVFITTGERLYTGCTAKNMFKSFIWSLAITSMHYVGIFALKIPDGYVTLNLPLVVLSASISWVVCLVGCILMSKIETHLVQQLLFAAVASTGVAAMHFTGKPHGRGGEGSLTLSPGMVAVTFWSTAPPSQKRGYPPALAVAIVSIAITTCMVANFLLAHVATVSRNKLAEIVWTRKTLWRTIAQKENAEAAAAARSDFIASASHEIRTPLHHLQGYSDLLSRTELTEEGRTLLFAIQHATKTLSLSTWSIHFLFTVPNMPRWSRRMIQACASANRHAVTNNVLDWSKLERDGEAVCRPTNIDMRTVCESVLMLLPNRDNEAEVDLMVVVSPDVPRSLLLDETYIQRILMNLVSNALKFTSSGYILLLVEVYGSNLVATVKDTGCGIPPSFLPDLFEPFKQAQTRGKQRGTGLGLSIIKQLLHKMEGTIDVDSNHFGSPGVQHDQSGSTFVITVPLSLPDSSIQGSLSRPYASKVAIFHNADSPQCSEGLCLAWKAFGFEATVVHQLSDLINGQWKYVWVDILALQRNGLLLNQLAQHKEWLVLVPYKDQEQLQQNTKIISTAQFVPIPKPLVWHSFEQCISASRDPANKAGLAKGVRFAPNVDIVGQEGEKIIQEEPPLKRGVVLLVEDNPVWPPST